MTASDGTGPLVTATEVEFFLNGYRSADSARLELDFPIQGTPDFTPVEQGWRLRIGRPAVERMEYQFSLVAKGEKTLMTDPGNPRQITNPFGAKSEIQFPGYSPPGWLTTELNGDLEPFVVGSGPLRTAPDVTLFCPNGLPADQPAPLLIAHDGTDMANRGSLLRWACSLEVPLRVALLDPAPGLRDSWYAADPVYADHVATTILPAITQRIPATVTVGLGASLGAVSMLTIQRRHPGSLAGLALQSGSFFTRRTDGQESGYDKFDQLCSAVQAIKQQTGVPGIPTLITCGAVEENRANNESMAAALATQSYDVALTIVPDAHTMIGWRNAWFPQLNKLIAQVGG